MRIAMVGPYPLDERSKYTGSLTYIERLTDHLARRPDIELHLITHGDEDKQLVRGKLTIHVVKMPKRFSITLFSLPILLMKLNRKIRAINPDIVHVFASHILPLFTVSLVARKAYPTLLTQFATMSKETWYLKRRKDVSFLPLLISALPERYVVSKISNIVVETSSVADTIRSWTKSKIHVIPDGIEFQSIQDMKRHPKEAPDIFVVTNIEWRKGLDVLIQAIPIVMKSIPALDVCIAGTGPEENNLKRLVKKLNLEKQVRFLGFVSEDDKYAYFKACKTAVIPARWENSPITLYEAMACGTPVIASKVGGIPGMLEDGKTGLLFESGNANDLANKIVTLLKDDRLRTNMGKTAWEKAKGLDWEFAAGRTAEVYHEILDARQKGSRDG